MNKTIIGECQNCESTYEVSFTEELVYGNLPEHCPFCGELIDDITEEYIEDDDSDDVDEKWD